MYPNTIIVISGPTAVGKTAVALLLAQFFHSEIISADSRQCFKELNIGVAKPSVTELSSVPHHFINSHSIYEEVNAGVFEQYALDAVDTIFKNHTVSVMVGGTGLYIKAFCEGMDDIPPVDLAIRQQILLSYEVGGMVCLQNLVAEKDPSFWAVAERENPQRLMRGLEVIMSCGQSITSFQQGSKKDRPFNLIKIGLEIPREQLYNQINSRVDVMIEQGLVDEAQSLLPKKDLNALQTVGYRELFNYFQGQVSLKEAIIQMKTNTRHYAKRQLTWFKRDKEITWFNPHSDQLFHFIRQQMASFKS